MPKTAFSFNDRSSHHFWWSPTGFAFADALKVTLIDESAVAVVVIVIAIIVIVVIVIISPSRGGRGTTPGRTSRTGCRPGRREVRVLVVTCVYVGLNSRIYVLKNKRNIKRTKTT